jgi:hypothetical protein
MTLRVSEKDATILRQAMRHWMKKHALPSHQPRRIIHALSHALRECRCGGKE